MKASELRNKLREITGEKSLTFRILYAKTKFGESHGNFVELYGNFVVKTKRNSGEWDVDYENESFGYANEDHRKELVKKLEDAGYHVYQGFVGKSLSIAVEVDLFYYGQSDVKNYDLITGEPKIHIDSIGTYNSKIYGYYLSRKF